MGRREKLPGERRARARGDEEEEEGGSGRARTGGRAGQPKLCAPDPFSIWAPED